MFSDALIACIFYKLKMPACSRGFDCLYVLESVCEISGRPVDNVYVKSSWSMSNFQNFVFNVQ